jgi:hypothetical protein
MRVLLRATIVAMALGVLLVTDVMAKGEQVSAVIGPITDVDAGTPTQVTATISMDGKAVTNASFPAALDFYEPVTRMAIDFPLRYDRSAGAWTATVTLPYKGRWLVEAVLRSGGGFAESFGSSTGTRVVTVNAAPATPAPAPLAIPLAIGALGASATWLLGLASVALRRRRQSMAAVNPPAGEQLPA